MEEKKPGKTSSIVITKEDSIYGTGILGYLCWGGEDPYLTAYTKSYKDEKQNFRLYDF